MAWRKIPPEKRIACVLESLELGMVSAVARKHDIARRTLIRWRHRFLAAAVKRLGKYNHKSRHGFVYTGDFRYKVVMNFIKSGTSLRKFARQLNIPHTTLHSWYRRFIRGGKNALFPQSTEETELDLS